MPTQWSEAEQVPLGCIAPYATALPWHISPSVMAFGHDTSLYTREAMIKSIP